MGIAVSVQGDSIAKIDAGQHGKNIGLNERNTDLQCVHGNRKRKGQPANQCAAGDGKPKQDP